MDHPKNATTSADLCALELGETVHMDRLPETTVEGERIYEAKSGLIEFERRSGGMLTVYRFNFRPDDAGVGITLQLVGKTVDYNIYR